MPMEGRLVGRINLFREMLMITTDYQETTETKLKRIAWLSSLDKGKKINNLPYVLI
ncbi:hypothetical protein REIS_1590 [Rickettsia endosymbiont of Ixodes scapularis]|nr:hypothetical protein REIS_1590 [Rickettsia endosymbiont of Ixodes scapularis]